MLPCLRSSVEFDVRGDGGWGRVFAASSPSAALRLRRCRKRVIRPRVFGVTDAQIFSYLKISCLPEAFEIIRDLYRTKVGAEEMQQDGHAPGGNARCVLPGEDFL